MTSADRIRLKDSRSTLTGLFADNYLIRVALSYAGVN